MKSVGGSTYRIILAFGLIYLVFYAMAPPPNTTTGV